MSLRDKTKQLVNHATSRVNAIFAALLITTLVIGMNSQTASAISGTASGGGVTCYTISNITAMKDGAVCAGISVGASYKLWPDARVQLPTTYNGSRVVVTVTLEQYYNGAWTVRGTHAYDLTSYLRTSKTTWAGGHDHTSGIPGPNYDTGYGSRSFQTKVSMKVGTTTVLFNANRTTKSTIYSPVQYTNFKP